MPDTTFYTNCLRIERTDGYVICLTELDKDLIIDDADIGVSGGVQTYISAAGYTPTNMQSTSNNAVNNADVEGVLSAVGVQREDIIGGRYDFAKLHIFLWDWENEVLVKKLGHGHWGEATIKDGSYVAEFRSLSQQLQQTIGRTYGPECDTQLGDPVRCQINLANYTETGVVTDVTDNANFLSSTTNTNITKANDIFNYGKLTFTGTQLASFSGSVTTVTSTTVFEDSTMNESDNTRDDRELTFTSGLNIGESRIITSQIGNVITVASAFTNPFTVTDEYIINGGNNNATIHMEVKDYIVSTDSYELFLAMPFEVNIGDTFTVYQGCDKKLATCKNDFSNHINFQGFPYIPGVDQISKFGGQ